MTYTQLDFGKYKGKTLPQILFKDPDWFFWAYENNVFENRGCIKDEADDINFKARNIRVPQKDEERQLHAEYWFDPKTKKFTHMELVPESRPRPNHTIRRYVIDLSVPRQVASYDKCGCKNLIKSLKKCLFGNIRERMSKAKCEQFFDNPDNFY